MKTCQLCETAEATRIKLECRITGETEGGLDITETVELEICAGCAAKYYDGTEEYPGTRPLR